MFRRFDKAKEDLSRNTALLARNNPFAVRYVEAIPFRFPEGDWDSAWDRLKVMNFRAAIVGQQGTGKSALMRQLHERWQARYRKEHECELCLVSRQAAERQTQFAMLTHATLDGTALLIDGWERFHWWHRWQLLRATRGGTGLVVALHRRNWLPVWVHCTSSESLLDYVLSHLPIDVDERLQERAREWLHQHRGNLRDTLRSLYDDYSQGWLVAAENQSSPSVGGCRS